MSQNKTITFPIRLTPEEHAAIKAASDSLGVSMSRFFWLAAFEKIANDKFERSPLQKNKQ